MKHGTVLGTFSSMEKAEKFREKLSNPNPIRIVQSYVEQEIEHIDQLTII